MTARWAIALLLLAPQGSPPELRAGLLAEYFELNGEIEDFPAIPADRKPALRRIEPQVNYESTEAGFGGAPFSDRFFARWTGLLRVPADGKYTFFTESDDGSRFFVGDTKVVDNGGLHAMEEKSGEIELKAGDHLVRLELFENIGTAGCRLSWEGPGVAKAVIPDKSLFHPRDKDLDKE